MSKAERLSSMLSYLLFAVAALLLLKLPVLLLGLFVKFAKPLGLIGVGCALGVSMSTGFPDFSAISEEAAPQHAQGKRYQESDFKSIDDFVSPEVIEAAITTFDDMSDAVSDFINEARDEWASRTEKRVNLARNASASDYRSIQTHLKRK
jgi:hypothetical protein